MFRTLLTVLSVLVAGDAFGHHDWSQFDEQQPIYLEGVVRRVKWSDPHAHVTVESNRAEAPAALTRFAIPRPLSSVAAVTILGNARPPARREALWEIEFASTAHMDAWKIVPVKVGDRIAVVGYALKHEKGEASLRVEFLIGNGKVTPMRTLPK